VRGYPCYSLSGPGRYGPVGPYVTPKTRQSVAGGNTWRATASSAIFEA